MEQIFVMLGAAAIFVIAVAYLGVTRGFKNSNGQTDEAEDETEGNQG